MFPKIGELFLKNQNSPKKVFFFGKIFGKILPPVPDFQIDIQWGNPHYDLIVYVDLVFQLDIKYPVAISDAEIWFERGTSIDQYVFQRALAHYEVCEQRRGK
ncbi:hypothetical protein EBI_24853 [Enterocytozoon bieneusi H348]|nr:hypothetical protein EBI_24853 [Enterocytozoon bieneusi H348]|eukprot:XP_002651092.1 hypothetical protein EBI_24853 [Enterocytozoon bieneusi H348]